MTDFVLDASAVLAVLQEESGSERVEAELSRGDCAISAVNLSEVAAKLSDRGASTEAVRAALGAMHLEVHPLDEEASFNAASLRTETRKAGLSLGDRACLALGRALGTPVLTTDRVWASLALDIEVVVVR